MDLIAAALSGPVNRKLSPGESIGEVPGLAAFVQSVMSRVAKLRLSE